MGYRHTYLRRLRAAKRLEKRLAVVTLLAMLACAAAVLWQREPVTAAFDTYVQADTPPAPAQPALRLVAAVASAPQAGVRRVYPFSVVPGGVSGRAELVHALQADRVVAVHYAGFEVARTSTVTVDKPRAVYVSYRKGDKVYWTRKRVTLAQGETLLSDGSNEIRTRCGNRISDVPRLPVADDEPAPQVLDTAMDVDADESADGQIQATAADGVPAAGRSYRLAAFARGAGLTSAAAHRSTALALLGMTGMAPATVPSIRPDRMASLSPTALGTQSGAAADSGTSTGTSGAGSGSGDTGGSTGSTGSSDAGSTSGSTTGGSGGGTTGGGTSTSGSGGGVTSGTPPTGMPVLGTGDDPPDTGTTVETPPQTDPSSPAGTPPVIIGKSPSKPVPEPGSLWLGGAALSAMLVLRRKPRRPRRGA